MCLLLTDVIDGPMWRLLTYVINVPMCLLLTDVISVPMCLLLTDVVDGPMCQLLTDVIHVPMCLLLTDVIGVPMCLLLKDIDVLVCLFAVYRCHRRIFRTQEGEWKTLRKLDEKTKTKKNEPLRHFKETDAEFKRALWSILHSLIFYSREPGAC